MHEPPHEFSRRGRFTSASLNIQEHPGLYCRTFDHALRQRLEDLLTGRRRSQQPGSSLLPVESVSSLSPLVSPAAWPEL